MIFNKKKRNKLFIPSLFIALIMLSNVLFLIPSINPTIIITSSTKIKDTSSFTKRTSILMPKTHNDGTNPISTLDYEMGGGFGWLPTETVVEDILALDLKVIVDGQNNIYIFWGGKDGSDWKIKHIMKYNGTSTWTEPEILASCAHNVYGIIDVVKDSIGRLHFVWDDDPNLRYMIYDNGTWINQGVICNGYQPMLVATSDSYAKVAYLDSPQKDTTSCYLEEYNNQSSLWETTTINSYTTWATESAGFDLSILEKNGQEYLYIVYGFVEQAGWYETTYTLYLNSYQRLLNDSDADVTQGDFSKIYEDIPATSRHFKDILLLTGKDGDQQIIYNKGIGDYDYKVVVDRHLNNQWLSQKTLSTETSSNFHLSGGVDPFGRACVVWNEAYYINSTQRSGLYISSGKMSGGDWNTKHLINPNYNVSIIPDLSFDVNGDLHLTWVEQIDNVRHIYYRKAYSDSDYDGLLNNEETDIYSTDPSNPDTDGDQFLDGEEIDLGFDPLNPDEDDDGMGDGYEYHYGLDPYTNDSYDDLDNDSLLNIYEYQADTRPDINDTDADDVSDYYEVMVYHSDPNDIDSDDDTLLDGLEINILSSDPNSPDSDNDTMPDLYEYTHGLQINVNDTMDDPDNDSLVNLYEYQYDLLPTDPDYDNDGLLDGEEVLIYFTNPQWFDSDGDFLSDFDEITIYNTDPNKMDTDDDLVDDRTEMNQGYDPLDNDTDNDLMIDGYEHQFGLDALNASDANLDYDGDTLTNVQEYQLWTNPFKKDSDGDKIEDQEEIELGINPAKADTDGEGLDDYVEIFVTFTNATNPDTDFDGLDDFSEIHIYSSNPKKQDSDGDTLLDGDEVYLYGSNPTLKDTDGDLLEDNYEVEFNSDPSVKDTDKDEMSDYFEWKYDLDPNFDDSYLDSDNDGITNLEEYFHQSNPRANDTDQDRISDYDEIIIYFTLPNHNDTDLDGLTDYEELFIYNTYAHDPDSDDDELLDGEEIYYGTNPLDSDTDSDGVIDGEEISAGTNPLDPNDNLESKRHRIIILLSSITVGSLLFYYIAPFIFTKLKKHVEMKWIKQGIKKRKKKSEKILEGVEEDDTS